MQYLLWLASQSHIQSTHAIILADSMNILQTVEFKSGTVCCEWHSALHCLQLWRLRGIYCPGQARVRGNDQADRPARAVDITTALQLGKADKLRDLKNFLKVKEDWRNRGAISVRPPPICESIRRWANRSQWLIRPPGESVFWYQ